MRTILAKRGFVLWSSWTTVATFSYFVLLAVFRDPRINDGVLSQQEMSWIEIAVTMHLLFVVLITWLSAVFHAFRTRRMRWGFLMLLLWPTAYLYAWKFSEWTATSGSRHPTNEAHRSA